MKKYTIFVSAILAPLLFAGCVHTTTPEQRLEQALNQEIQKINTNTQEFIEKNLGKTPEEVLITRHEELLAKFGQKEIYAFKADGTPGYPIAFYLAQQLDIEYAKLAFVQYQSGTMGLQGLLETMDPSAPGVTSNLELVKKYHAMTEPGYYEENMPSGLSDQEQAEYIVQTIYDVEVIFYPEKPELTNAQLDLVEKLSNLTNLSKDQLSVLADQWKMYSAFEIMPDSLPYKEEALRLIDEVY